MSKRSISYICNSHLLDYDSLVWRLQLLSIANGLAEPSEDMNTETAPLWMHELVDLCKTRKPRLVLNQRKYGEILIVR